MTIGRGNNAYDRTCGQKTIFQCLAHNCPTGRGCFRRERVAKSLSAKSLSEAPEIIPGLRAQFNHKFNHEHLLPVRSSGLFSWTDQRKVTIFRPFQDMAGDSRFDRA
jgi:hypothetical protein